MRAVTKYSLQLWATIVLHSWFASWNSWTRRLSGNGGGKTNLPQFVNFHDNERKQRKMLQPMTIRKFRWDSLPLPWENWYETVQSLQAGKIWAFKPNLVWCKGLVYVFHPTIYLNAWSDWCQRLMSPAAMNIPNGWWTTFKSMEFCNRKTFPLIDTSPA